MFQNRDKALLFNVRLQCTTHGVYSLLFQAIFPSAKICANPPGPRLSPTTVSAEEPAGVRLKRGTFMSVFFLVVALSRLVYSAHSPSASRFLPFNTTNRCKPNSLQFSYWSGWVSNLASLSNSGRKGRSTILTQGSGKAGTKNRPDIIPFIKYV